MTDQYMLFGGSGPLDAIVHEFTLVRVATDLLGKRVQKRPISPRWRALCPLHDERTPSFYLEPQWDRFKCYGCGRQGGPLILAVELRPDPITYLRKYALRPEQLLTCVRHEMQRFGRRDLANLLEQKS